MSMNTSLGSSIQLHAQVATPEAQASHIAQLRRPDLLNCRLPVPSSYNCTVTAVTS